MISFYRAIRQRCGWRHSTDDHPNARPQPRARQGRIYFYHRKTGTRLDGEPGTPEFFAQLDALNKPKCDVPPAADGTFARMARLYLASPEYLGLAERTRSDYREVIDYLTERMGKVPLVKIDGPAIFSVRDKTMALRKRRFANYVVRMLRLLFAWARPRGHAPGLVGTPPATVSSCCAWFRPKRRRSSTTGLARRRGRLLERSARMDSASSASLDCVQ